MKVLVATDGSEHSMKAVQRGLELAEKTRGPGDPDVGGLLRRRLSVEGMPPNIRQKLEDEAESSVEKGQGLV